MGDVREFVTARLDEVAAAAEAATPGPWECNDEPEKWMPHEGRVWALEMPDDFADEIGQTLDHADSKYIALIDPAAVLSMVAALRAVVAAHHEGEPFCRPGGVDRRCAAGCYGWPCLTITLLAAAWKDHSEYPEVSGA